MSTSNKTMKIRVVGATGLVGKTVLQVLSGTEELEAWVRKPGTLATTHAVIGREMGLVETVVDFAALEKRTRRPCDGVVIALGSTIKKAGSREAFFKVDHDAVVDSARASMEDGARRLVVISSRGADSKSPLFYLRVKGLMENSVEQLRQKFPSCEVFFLRPGILDGDREEFRPGERLALSVLRLLKPIHPILKGPLEGLKTSDVTEIAKEAIQFLRAESQVASPPNSSKTS